MTDPRSFDESRFDESGFEDSRLDEVEADADAIERRRLADSLELIELGGRPVIDQREDPELHALVEVASIMRSLSAESTDTAAFRSYRQRSRAYVMQAAGVYTQALVPATSRSVALISQHVPWYRRWALTAPVAAAAAAVLAVIAILGPFAPGNATPQPGNLSTQAIDQELARVQEAVAAITTSTESGTMLQASDLRSLTDGTVTLAVQIANNPHSVEKETVVRYIQTTHLAQSVLRDAEFDEGSREALMAAREATDDGFVVAADYLVDDLNAQVAARDGYAPLAE